MSCAAKGVKPETVMEYCAGTLDEHAARIFELHSTKCAECERALTEHRQLWKLLDTWDDVPISPDFNTRLYKAIEREQTEGPARRWISLITARVMPFRWRPALPPAAMGMALAVALMITTPGPELPPPDTQIKTQTIDADQVERALDDIDMLKTLSDSSTAAM